MDSRGLSLVEILVALALIASMVIIGAPALITQMTHLRLTRSTRDMATELNAARIKAISMNMIYGVRFTLNADPTPDTFRLAYRTAPADPLENDTGRAARNVNPGVDITNPGASFDVEFKPNGTATAAVICVQNIRNANDRMKITVAGTTGMITVTTGC